MKYLIVFLLTIASFFALNEAAGDCGKNRVQFINQIAKGVILKVNCTSLDNTLHTQFLPYKGKPYQIIFDEAFGGSTRWLCTLQHGKITQDFRAYNQGSMFPRCGQKRDYFARKDGIYLSKNLGPTLLKLNWAPPKP
ncbi:hypothetical protein AALP_AA7G279300 [Arabis alpina]|uniref:S-protein homolog n=1 Tax=Arabis alpina TaxID=50452 RepID=A0A087GL20_ARAAL|nr:hypothetical protein AALP_AA7G279300 [Arabis alpina]